MQGSIRIGSIAGINIYIHFSWLIIIVLLTISLASGWFPQLYPGYATSIYFLLGLLSAILLFISILLHELGHSLVAKARGLPVKSIILYIFGGVSNIEQEPHSAGVEFQMAFVGPMISLLIAALSYGAWILTTGNATPIKAIFAYLAVTNFILGIFNLLPGFPLDGGRVLRSIVWKITGNVTTATNVATITGQVIAYLIILSGIFLFFTGNTFSGIWIGFIGWFLLNTAQSARTQMTLDTVFRGVTVQQVMSKNMVTVPANISLQKLVDEFFLPEGLRSAFVMQADQLAGLITLSDIRHIPREQWLQTPVGFAMVPLERLHVVSPQQNLREVLTLMNNQNINQLPVVENSQLIGVLSREHILRWLEVRQSLGMTLSSHRTG